MKGNLSNVGVIIGSSFGHRFILLCGSSRKTKVAVYRTVRHKLNESMQSANLELVWWCFVYIL